MSWTATPQEIALLDRTIERIAPYFEKPDIGQDNVARVRDVLNSISGGAVGATMENTDLRRTYMFCKLLRHLCAQPPPVPVASTYFFAGSIFGLTGPLLAPEIRFYFADGGAFPSGINPKFRLDFLPVGDTIWLNGVFIWSQDQNLSAPDTTGLAFYSILPDTDIPDTTHLGDRYRVSICDEAGTGAQFTAYHYVISDIDNS